MLRYHNVVLLIDENSNQPALPGGLLPVRVSRRQETEVMDVGLLAG